MKNFFAILSIFIILLSLSSCKNESQINCHACRKDISATAAFCEHCGTAVNTTEIPESTSETTDSSASLSFEPSQDLTSYTVTGLREIPASTDITIPENYDGHPVTAIADYAFRESEGITSIFIPASIVNIGEEAFADCTNLSKICVDENNAYFTSDSNGTLYNKEMTTIIAVPAGISGEFNIPSGVTVIEMSAFSGCSKLSNISIPDTTTKICAKAFAGCTGLTKITIPDSVTTLVGDSTGRPGPFHKCTALEEITLSSGLKVLDGSLFNQCTNLTTVTVRGKDTSGFDWALNGVGSTIATIYGVPGSEAESFAKANDIAFVSLH